MAISVYGIKPYYVDNVSALYRNDTFEVLSKMTPESIDLIFADPPYFLSNGGISCSGGKAVKVDKGEWDKVSTLQEKHQFNRKWISLCKRVLKPDGTIWISGTMHNIYSVGMALEEEGFKIINNIVWQKTNPPPNLACRCFTHSTETLLWAKKNKTAHHLFNYELMKNINEGKQMKDVWTGPLTSSAEKSLESIRPKNHCIYSNALFLLLRKKETLFLTRFAVLQRQALLAENQDGFILELTIALNTLKYLKKGLRMYEKKGFF